MDNKTREKITDAAIRTSDPIRAETNLIRFIESSPKHKLTAASIIIAAKLFAASQFLANFCINNPDELYSALKERKKNITKRYLAGRAGRDLMDDNEFDIYSAMKSLRLFKKRYMLRITLRDITDETDIQAAMDEITLLAETIIAAALGWSIRLNEQKFGKVPDSSIAIIGLGKLGGEELNYSSDVDLIAVYDHDDGQSGGIPNPSGIMFNRISNHEFYCKVVELFGKLLSTLTEDGFAYRVDLRLRPQGQKGDIALPLKAYKTYYESWGRTWERMVLIRARPVAGNMELGKSFMKIIEPFVWKKTVDYSEIEEIRGMKKKIDSTYTRGDIKRGYGGIREAEFFIQTFQLLYAGTNKSLKSYRILNAIQALRWMKIVPDKELTTLWDNYIYLRKVEHYLQMKEDLQTHTLPSSESELEALSRIMGYDSSEDFLSNLRLKRMQIKKMYNSLLGTREDQHAEALNVLESKLSDQELRGYLSFSGVHDPDKCLVNMKRIREHISAFRTMQERSVARDIMPQLLESALAAEYPDRALAGLDSLLTTYGIKTAHLRAIIQQKELMQGIINVFSFSQYLTGIFLSSQHYLDILIEEWSIVKTQKEMEERLGRAVQQSSDFGTVLAEFRRYEEVRMGILFLSGILQIEDLFRGLSQLAEVIVGSIVERVKSMELSVIAMGKLGGQEMTFGSDLDIVFVSETSEAMAAAEKILKALTSYTDMGLLYHVDTRLRPDGSKGVLVNNIDGYRQYYLDKAQNWEIQALLKARHVGGNQSLGLSFINMTKEVVLQRGANVQKDDIKAMRERIVNELSLESEGIDIKLGPGGVEEIEFYVQFLQLQYSQTYTDLLVQNTLIAIDRLADRGFIGTDERNILYETYKYFRKVQTFLRLNESSVIAQGENMTHLSARFMEHENGDEFIDYVKSLREKVMDVITTNRS
jgi:glutamate-ammonia-ligase adenylyltransferase